MIGGVAVKEVVVVTVDRIDVASLVNTHIDELMSIADSVRRVIVDDVICEGLTTIGGDCHPDDMVATCTLLAANNLVRVGNTTKGLVNDVVFGINSHVAGRVV